MSLTLSSRQLPQQSLPDNMSNFCACRYTVEEAVELLKLIGFRNTDVVEAHGITGGDLLELDEHELRDELKLPHLQVQLLAHLIILTRVDQAWIEVMGICTTGDLEIHGNSSGGLSELDVHDQLHAELKLPHLQVQQQLLSCILS